MSLRGWQWIPVGVFALLWLHGATLGLTDDEAYYWVLAQHPALGYAYHPPGVAWIIAITQACLGWIFGTHSPALVRLPAASISALILGMGLSWIKSTGVPSARLYHGALLLLSFAGFFGASWMMVPDLPLWLGWMITFLSAWKIIFNYPLCKNNFLLALGAFLAVISKYSGVLVPISAGIALLLWAPKKQKIKGLLALFLGMSAALLPIFIWNQNHQWASVLYQIRDRHGDLNFSFSRYLRFLGTQFLLAGPVLIIYSYFLFLNCLKKERTALYLAVWTIPSALIFCIQPAWSDFKPHWALVVWLPVALGMALDWGHGKINLLPKMQTTYGLTLIIIALVSCHFPVENWFFESILHKKMDPKLDVTNDMYGWNNLENFIRSQKDKSLVKLPIIGSRYQTAAQAAFALGNTSKVSKIPRDMKETDEWPDLGISSGQGPAWPELKSSILFIADNRYNSPPEFLNSDCRVIGKIEQTRLRWQAKIITVWKCDQKK